jgi:hypothetical protein
MQHWLRMMVGGLLLTFIIDLVQLIFYFEDLWGYDKEDGGVETGIRQFTVVMMIISVLI